MVLNLVYLFIFWCDVDLIKTYIIIDYNFFNRNERFQGTNCVFSTFEKLIYLAYSAQTSSAGSAGVKT